MAKREEKMVVLRGEDLTGLFQTALDAVLREGDAPEDDVVVTLFPPGEG